MNDVTTATDKPTEDYGLTATGQPRKRKPFTRSPSSAKPVYVILQVLDDSGQPMQVDKKRVKLLGVERDSDVVLQQIDGGEHEHAFYIRASLPPMK